MLLNTKTDVKRSGMILLIVVAFLSMFLVVGTTYLLVADSIRRTSDFDLNATDKRSDFALMTDIDPRYMFNFALGQILYDVSDPLIATDGSGKILTTNSALRGHSLARSIYGGYNAAGGNDRPFQGSGKSQNELDFVNYMIFGPVPSMAPFNVNDPEKGVRTVDYNTPANRISNWNSPYTFPDKSNLFLGSYSLDSNGNAIINPSYHRDNIIITPAVAAPPTPAVLIGPLNSANPYLTPAYKVRTLRPTNVGFPTPDPTSPNGMDVKNLEGYPGGNDSIWIDAGFPVMTTPDGRKYKALIAPLILDLDGRINLNVAGNLMQRDAANPNFTADHASNQGWGRWEINPKKLIDPSSGLVPYPGQPQYSPFSSANEFLNLLSYDADQLGMNPRAPAATRTFSSITNWKTFGRFFKADYLPINSNPPLVTNFTFVKPHSYAQVDFNGAGDSGVWGVTTKPTFDNLTNGFPVFNGTGFGNGYAYDYDQVTMTNIPNVLLPNEHFLNPANPLTKNYHARNYNPYRTQSSGNDVSTVFPVSETASILRWQGKGEPFSKSQIAQLLPKSLGLDMPYESASSTSNSVNKIDGIFRQRIRNMVTTLSADLDRPAMVPIIPDTNAHTLRFGDFLFPERTVAVTIPNADFMPPVMPPPMPPIKGYNPIGDVLAVNPNLTSPAFKVNLSRYLTPFPNLFQDNTTDITNYIDYASNSAIFIKAQDDRTKFATELFDSLRNVTGIIKYESVITNPAFAGDLLEIKRSNRWLAQLAANIVDFIDADDFNTVFNWYTGDIKDVVFGVELPRVVINEVYSMAQNDSTDPFNNNQNATLKTHIYTAIELMNPLPTDGIYGVGPGGHNAVLQFKYSTGIEYQNYRLVLCKSGQVSGQMNAINGNYFNNTGSHDFNGTNIAMDSNGMAKAILDNWTNPNIMPVANMVPAAWYLNAGGFMVVSDDTTLRMEANPEINSPFKTPKIKLKIMNKDQDPDDDNAPEVMLQKLVYPGLPHNDYDTTTNMLTDGTLPYNPYITVDIFSKRKMWDLRKFNETGARNPDVTNTSSKGRKSPFLDSSGMDISVFSKNMYNGNNSGDQQLPPPPPVQVGAKHTMGQANSNAQNLPWLAHLDRQLINPLELIHVSTVKPHELTQTANRWNFPFNQKSIHPTTNMPVTNSFNNNNPYFPSLTKYPYAHNWPWFDENTRLYRFLEAVGVSPLQAGEAMHGRALGKVNINTMHSEEVFQAVADAKNPAGPNNFSSTDVNTAFKKLTGDGSPDQRPIASFGQANNVDFSNAVSKKGFNKSLLGYQSFNNANAMNAEVPFGNLLDVQGFSASGQSPAIYARKELLTKIGNSVTTKSNVFAVWITTGYFEVTNDTTQPPTLGLEIGKADGINIRHRMFAIVDRTNMSAFTTNLIDTGLKYRYTPIPPNPPDPLVDLPTTPIPGVGPCPNISAGMIVVNWNRTGVNQSGKSWSFSAGMLLTFDPNTDNEETVQLEDVGGGVLGAKFMKNHAGYCTIINRGNPGPWVGYDRTKDRDVVPYAEIIE